MGLHGSMAAEFLIGKVPPKIYLRNIEKHLIMGDATFKVLKVV